MVTVSGEPLATVGGSVASEKTYRAPVGKYVFVFLGAAVCLWGVSSLQLSTFTQIVLWSFAISSPVILLFMWDFRVVIGPGFVNVRARWRWHRFLAGSSTVKVQPMPTGLFRSSNGVTIRASSGDKCYVPLQFFRWGEQQEIERGILGALRRPRASA